jgi:cell wall-associated NlpC family hydrolase
MLVLTSKGVGFAAATLLRLTATALLLIALFGCSSSVDVPKDSQPPVQNNLYYLDGSAADRELVTEEYGHELRKRFMDFYFSPWHRSAPIQTRSEIEGEIQKFRRNPGYGENYRRHTGAWVNDLERSMNLQTYPNASFKAITTVNSDLRTLPTLKPHFNSLKTAGKSYPFDNLQNSGIPANTPIFISHVAADKSWVLAESGFARGWIAARQIARVDDDFTAIWENSGQIAILKDHTPIYDENGAFLFYTGLGAQFPGGVGNETEYRILVATSDENMRARIRNVVVSRDAASEKPLALTQTNVARLANDLLNKPYGWGGIYQNRDCSSTLKDLFAPFNIWLPRHSAQQATQGGTFVSLHGLSDEEKEARIVKEAIPFTTLLWSKGHIMLYIGSLKGRAMVFHNTWGIKTVDAHGKKGKKIIGKTVISSLHPAASLSNADLSKGDLITRIEGMTFLLPKTTRQDATAG